MHVRYWLLIGLVALSGSGCAGYKLGPVNGQTAGARSVQINPFTNTTLEPRLGDEVTAQLRKQVQRDGTFHLASHDDADIVVAEVQACLHRGREVRHPWFSRTSLKTSCA